MRGILLILLTNIKSVNKLTIGVNSLTKSVIGLLSLQQRGREVIDIIKNKKPYIWYCMARDLHYI